MKKRLLSVILGIALTFSVVVAAPVRTSAAAIGKVTLTVEKLSIGQGMFCQPIQMTIYSGDTVKSVFDRYMDSVSGLYKYSTIGGWYITGIGNADLTRKAYIPNEIANMPDVYKYTYLGEDKLEHEYKFYAPNTNNNFGNTNTSLEEKDYSFMSGWVYTINNNPVFSGASFDRTDANPNTDPNVRNIYKPEDKVVLKNGDVIRIMYTVFGYGADVGIDTYTYTEIENLRLANKTELLRTIADVNAKKSYWLVYPNVKSCYDTANSLVNSFNPSAAAVNSATTKLKAALKNPVNPIVPQAKISSAKNVKGKKIKVKVTKVANASGYQYKYGNNKKLKNKKKKKQNAKTYKTTKTTYTTKKIKNVKKKKAYVKVRAYRKVNGTTIYGKWSGIKTVKIKK